MKKLLSMLVIICVLISACLVGAMPASAAEINYDDFDIYDGILVEYLGEGGDVVIPAKDADGNPVTEIDARAFMDNDTITSVKIPEGITKMGSECFQYCDYLETVDLPYSLEKCGFAAFRHCKSLTKIEIPASLKSIPQDFCSEANALSEIVISYGVEKIGVYAFCGMKNIDRIVIPASVTDLFGYSFANCSMAECDVYICNPLCDVGYMNGYKGAGSKDTGKEYKFAFSSPQHARTSWTIYVPKGSTVASDMNKQAETYSTLNYRIREAEQSVFDALPENQKDYGYQGVKDENVDNDGDGVADGQQGGDNAGDNNNTIGGILGGGNASNGSGLNLTTLLIIFGAGFGGLILIIIAVVVIVIVVKNNKKKKKAAAKAARRAAKAAAEAPVEEAPVEEIVDEVPAEDAE